MIHHFHSLYDFLQMGGYAAYVWSAYGLFILIFFISIALARYQRRKIIQDIRTNLNDPMTTTIKKHTFYYDEPQT